MKLKLIVGRRGTPGGKALLVNRASVRIGRETDCQLRATSEEVSRRHCDLTIEGEQAFLHDLGSKNGTFVNGRPVRGKVELHNDDLLAIGPLRFVVRLQVGEGKTGRPTRTPAPASTVEDEALAIWNAEDPQPVVAVREETCLANAMTTEIPVEIELLEAGDAAAPTRVRSAASGFLDTEQWASAAAAQTRGPRPPKGTSGNSGGPDTASAAQRILRRYQLRLGMPGESH